jgi:hypothetical protein
VLLSSTQMLFFNATNAHDRAAFVAVVKGNGAVPACTRRGRGRPVATLFLGPSQRGSAATGSDAEDAIGAVAAFSPALALRRWLSPRRCPTADRNPATSGSLGVLRAPRQFPTKTPTSSAARKHVFSGTCRQRGGRSNRRGRRTARRRPSPLGGWSQPVRWRQRRPRKRGGDAVGRRGCPLQGERGGPVGDAFCAVRGQTTEHPFSMIPAVT